MGWYVPTDMNPADLGTRGMTRQELTDSTKWWNRPDFLCSPEAEWPECKFDKPSREALCERKLTPRLIDESSTSYNTIQRLVNAPKVEEEEWHLEPSRYSKWYEVKLKGQLEVGLSLVRVRSWLQWFVSNCRRPENQRVFGELTPVELMTVLRQEWTCQDAVFECRGSKVISRLCCYFKQNVGEKHVLLYRRSSIFPFKVTIFNPLTACKYKLLDMDALNEDESEEE